jgi:hypothetical protein
MNYFLIYLFLFIHIVQISRMASIAKMQGIANVKMASDGTVMVCEINEVNDRPVGKPQEQGVMNIAASFSLSKKPRLSIQ